MSRESEGPPGLGLADPVHLIKDPARLDYSHPFLRRALPFAHSGFGGLLGHGLIRENADPDFSASLHVTSHRDPGRLNLAGRKPTRLQRLQPELPETDRGTGSCNPFATPSLHLAIFYFCGHQHNSFPRAVTVPETIFAQDTRRHAGPRNKHNGARAPSRLRRTNAVHRKDGEG